MVFQWAKDWVVDKVYNAAHTTIQAGGTMAGNAVGGVGSLIENSGRGVGQSIAGAIGGVGGYINNYGQSIIDATAPSGGSGSAEKKTAVKPSTAVSKSATAVSRPAASAQRSVTAASKPKAVSASPAPAPRAVPSKPPPPGPQRNLPAKKPNHSFPQKSAGSGLNKIAAGKEDRTADGKIRVSPASRPQPVKSAGVSNGPIKSSAASVYGGPKTSVNNAGPRPLPKISAGKNDRTADGKIKISPASRPRPVVKAS